MPVANGVRFRNACFTINNPPMDENQGPGAYQEPSWCPEKMRYLGYALERGTSGTVHWQGYVELRSQLTLQSLKVLLGNNPHLEGRKGTAQQARDYFALPGEKPGETLQEAKEFGELSSQGKRSDLLEVVAAVKVINKLSCTGNLNWAAHASDAYWDALLAHYEALHEESDDSDMETAPIGWGVKARLSGAVSPSSDQVRERDQSVEGGSQASTSLLLSEGSGVPLWPTRHRQVHQGHPRSP